MSIRKIVSNVVGKAKRKVMAAMALIMSFAYSDPVRADTKVSAAPVTPATDAGTVVSNVIGIILLYAQYIGSALLVWGLVMFAMAVKSDEPESKQKALATAIAGIIAMTLRSILKGAGIIS